MKKQQHSLKSDLTEAETEMLLDIAEGRFTNYYLLQRRQKHIATALASRGFIVAGKKERRVPLSLTEEGKRLLAR